MSWGKFRKSLFQVLLQVHALNSNDIVLIEDLQAKFTQSIAENEKFRNIRPLVLWKNRSIENNHRSIHQRCSVRKGILEISQNSQESTCARVSFLIKLKASACNFIKKETLAQVLSCEFYEFLRTLFLAEHLRLLLLKENIFLTFSNIPNHKEKPILTYSNVSIIAKTVSIKLLNNIIN